METQKAYAATLGLDWADKKHDIWLHSTASGKAEHIVLEHTPEGLHEWIAKLRAKFPGATVALGVETSRGPVLHALMVYDFIDIYPINPKALCSYRQAFCVSGSSNDRTDAMLLEEYVRLHHSKLKVLRPDTELTRRLAGLGEKRRQLVDQRTELVNQLHSELKTYFPLAEQLLPDMTLPLASDFLLKWGDLDALQKASPEKLRAFFYAQNSRSNKLMEERLQAIKQARALTTDSAIVIPARLKVQGLAAMLKALHKVIALADQLTKEAMDQHPDAPIFRSFPCAGPALAPRLLAAFGTQRDRFQSAADVQQLYGLAPVREQSGQSETIHIRYRCPKFGRQTFHENARMVWQKEPWARAYYEQQRAKNKGHHAAVRSLAFKLIRIYTACWKTRTPYDPDRYLAALKNHGSPLIAKLAAAGE